MNAGIVPCIPGQGSVGASGDLAPLAHLSAVLIGEGEARINGDIVPGAQALALAGLQPIELAPKEGSGAAQRHAGVDGAGARGPVRGRARDVRRIRRRRDDGRRVPRQRHAIRCANSHGTAPSRTDRRRRRLSRPVGRQRHPRVARRLQSRAGSVQPALPAASDGRLPRSVAVRRRRAAHGGQRSVRQSAGVRGRQRDSLRRQLSRGTRGVRRRQPGAGSRGNGRAVGAPHRVADGHEPVGVAAVPGQGRRRQFGLHDRAGDRRGVWRRKTSRSRIRRRSTHCPHPPTRRITSAWRRSRRGD